MDEGSLKHPGDDLHVPVGVDLEAGPGQDDVVVVDQQQAVVGVVGVVVLAERERVLGVEPTDAGLEPVLGAADVDVGEEDVVHGLPSGGELIGVRWEGQRWGGGAQSMAMRLASSARSSSHLRV